MTYAKLSVALVLILSVVLGACESSAPPAAPKEPAASAPAAKPAGAESAKPLQPTRGGALRVGMRSNPSSLDPIRGNQGHDQHVLFQIYSTLVEADEGLSPKPGLAERWDVSPDLKTYTFYLRKGVKFQDGTDFNAEAVKAQVQRIQDPATKATSALPEVQGVDVPDNYTVRFNLKTPSVALPLVLADRAGMIASPTAVQKYGAEFGRNPVGAGPFKFVEWLQDDHITLQRFDGYWEQGLPYLDGIEYKIIPDQPVLLTNLRSGSVDFMYEVPERDAVRLKDDPKLKIVTKPSGWLRMVFVNSLRPPFDNKALREAVSLAVDRDAIIKGPLFGVAEPSQGIVPPSSWAYDPDIHPRKRDLAKAKEKLVEGGKPNGFKTEAMISNNPASLEAAEAIKAQLAEVGIQMDIQVVTVTEAGSRLVDSKLPYQLAIMSWTGRTEIDDSVTLVHHSRGGFNQGRYGEAKATIDPLIEQARATADPNTRKEKYRQAQAVINDEALDLFFYFQTTTAGMSPRVEGHKIYGDAKMRFKDTWMQK